MVASWAPYGYHLINVFGREKSNSSLKHKQLMNVLKLYSYDLNRRRPYSEEKLQDHYDRLTYFGLIQLHSFK